MDWTEELLARLLPALPVGDVRAAIDEPEGRLWAISEVASPDLETVMIAAGGVVEVEYRGVEGYVEAWREWAEPFDAYRVEMEELRDLPDGALVLIRQWSRPRGTTAEIAGEGAALLRFDGDRLARIEFHLDRSSALRAAGLA